MIIKREKKIKINLTKTNIKIVQDIIITEHL